VQVSHFTEGATDPLQEIAARGAHFVELTVGAGDSHLGCLHLEAGGNLPRRSISQDCALLTVRGSITFIEDSGLRLAVASGTGVGLNANEYFASESHGGGIVMLIRCPHLTAHEDGISTPRRIAGQQWPGDAGLHVRSES